jgi:galactokinase
MIRIRAPGRICLFGEHQDYLNYPVIAMAISKYIYLKAKKLVEPSLIIELPDINESIEIKLNKKELEYQTKRDYLRSGYNQFLRKGRKFDKGYMVKISGDIPINAGVASSSALIIAWLYFLNLISEGKDKYESYQIALEGYNTEVIEFNEAGGMMDHFISTFGNLIYLELKHFKPDILNFNNKLEGFVLGNSLEKKQTIEDLIKVKRVSIKAFEVLKDIMPKFDQYLTSIDDIKPFLPNLEKKYQKKIIGNIYNRDITFKAKNLIKEKMPLKNNTNVKVKDNFYRELGNLLNEHHNHLRDNIEISTNKIEEMISNCLKSGALGAKINGSGFGGTMFALFPGGEKILKNSIENAGGEAFLIETSGGVEMY